MRSSTERTPPTASMSPTTKGFDPNYKMSPATSFESDYKLELDYMSESGYKC